MTDADFSARVVEILRGEGPRKLLSSAMQEAQLALTQYGFEFHTPEKPNCSAKQEWLVDTVPPGSRLRLAVQAFDPARNCVMEIRVYLFVPSSSSSRGRINSWFDAVDLAVLGSDEVLTPDVLIPPATSNVLVRKWLFFAPPADPSLADSELDDLLTSRLKGEWLPGEEPDFEVQARVFATKVDVALSH